MKTKLAPFIVLATLLSGFAVPEGQAMRWYSPTIGRWFSRDPIGEESFFLGFLREDNEAFRAQARRPAYIYVDNAPTFHIDPLGLAIFRGCSPAQQQALQDNLEAFCNDVIAANDEFACCLKKEGVGFRAGGLARCMKRKCENRNNITFICESKSTGDCKDSYAHTKPWGSTIHICPDFWTGPVNSDQGCTIMHEIAHTCFRTEGSAEKAEKCLGCNP